MRVTSLRSFAATQRGHAVVQALIVTAVALVVLAGTLATTLTGFAP